MKNKLFFFILFNCVCLALPAQQREKRPFWKVELEGALNNYDAWEVEPSITFLPIQYAGISLGLHNLIKTKASVESRKTSNFFGAAQQTTLPATF